MSSTRSSSAPRIDPVITPEQYLAMERDSQTLHILWDGEVFEAMGATPTHNLVTAALIAGLSSALRGKHCRTYASQQRVRIPGRGYVYPDASVVCGAMQTDPLDPDTALNPRLIAEVLSPYTESFDRGAKWIGYQSIPSLTDFLFLLQTEPRVEHYTRRPEGGWLLNAYGPGAKIPLASFDAELSIDDLYDGAFPSS